MASLLRASSVAFGAPLPATRRATWSGIETLDELPASIDDPRFSVFAPWLGPPVMHPRGTIVHRAGSPSAGLLLVCIGACKSMLLTEDGTEDIVAFHMSGELLGGESFGVSRHATTVVALEDTQVRSLPFAHIEQLVDVDADARTALLALLATEIAGQRKRMTHLYAMRVQQRVAAFLLDLSARFGRLGFSPHQFNLAMTRTEMGRYLGVKQETICRTFSWMHGHGIVQVQGRQIKLVDRAALQQILGDADALRVRRLS